MSRLGVQVAATTPPAELAAIAAEVERLGYGELWLAEDYFQLGGIASVATVLRATERIQVGLGVVASVARHPAVTAMEFATLGITYPGRFMGGLGHGVPAWVAQMGLSPRSVLGSLREAATGIRRLLDGEEVSSEGEYFAFDRVRLLHPPSERVPLYFGVSGPRSLQLAGELADGTLLGWFSSPEYVAWACERIDEGRESAGRADRHTVAALCILSLSDDDPDAARREISRWATRSLAGRARSPEMLATDAGRELAAWFEAQGESADVPEPLLHDFVAAGDMETCAWSVQRLLDEGADRVVLVPNPDGIRTTPEMVDQIRAAAGLVAI